MSKNKPTLHENNSFVLFHANSISSPMHNRNGHNPAQRHLFHSSSTISFLFLLHRHLIFVLTSSAIVPGINGITHYRVPDPQGYCCLRLCVPRVGSALHPLPLVRYVTQNNATVPPSGSSKAAQAILPLPRPVNTPFHYPPVICEILHPRGPLCTGRVPKNRRVDSPGMGQSQRLQTTGRHSPLSLSPVDRPHHWQPEPAPNLNRIHVRSPLEARIVVGLFTSRLGAFSIGRCDHRRHGAPPVILEATR